MALAPLFVPGGLGAPELLIVFFIAILLFGANKLPKLARSSGEAIGEFKKGRQQVEEDLQEIQEGAPDVDASETETTETTTDPDEA